MLVTGQNQVGPNLVGDDIYIVFFEQLHGTLDFPAFPDTATGIMRAAENSGVDVILYNFLFHIVKVHAIGALRILEEGRMENMVAVVGQRTWVWRQNHPWERQGHEVCPDCPQRWHPCHAGR